MLKHRLGKLLAGNRLLAPFRVKRRLKLRFGVNQAAAQTRGFECRNEIVTLEILPEQLAAQQRRLLEQRLLGIDVCEGIVRADGTKGPAFTYDRDTYQDPRRQPSPCRLVAELPTLDGLMEAIWKDECRLEERRRARSQQRA